MFDSELKVMNLIWGNEPVSAKQLSLLAAEQIGWNKNTTYTILKKLESKGYIRREDPQFICTSLISRDEASKNETKSLIDKFYGGSKKALFLALLNDEDLSKEDIAELRKLVEGR